MPHNSQLERLVLVLMALVQFVNIWDFMIVMPMGPDFAHALGVDAAHIGWISGSYSITAAIVGLLCARSIDRFDRRKVLLFCLAGLTASTMAMTLANTLYELIAVRMITGAFGGPLVATSLAVISDVFPEQRRGEAMGKVFGSFSIASVVGVPLGLEIAHWWGWWAPFVAVSLFAAVIFVTILLKLPSMRGHLENRVIAELPLFQEMIRNPAALLAVLLMATSTFSLFMIIPNISAHVQQNMGYPREWLGLLYFTGGIAAFFSMRYAGKQADRIGAAKTGLYYTIGLAAAVFIGFYAQIHAVPVIAVFIAFMIFSSSRNVTSNALISKIPHRDQRAGFMSLMSATQHLMSGAGAMCSTLMLTDMPDGRLGGVDHIALVSLVLFMVMPWAMFRIEYHLKKRAQAAAS